MSEDQHGDWQRLSALAIPFILFKFIRVYWFSFVPVLLANKNSDFNIWILFFAILGVLVILSVLRYYFFRYLIHDDKIAFKTGFILRKSREISRDRIQNINIEQNIIYQLFKLKHVKLESAGSSKTEFEFPAISESAVKEIQTFLKQSSDAEEKTVQSEQTDVLVRLKVKDLLIHALTSGRIGIVVGGIFTFYDSIKQNLADWFDTYIDIEDYINTEQVLNNSDLLIAFYVIFILSSVFIISILIEIIIYYGFTLRIKKTAFKKTYGLFTKKEDVLEFQKVQTVYHLQNPVMRLFKKGDTHLKIADSAVSAEQKKSFSIIALSRSVQDKIETILFGALLKENSDSFSVNKRYIIQYIKYNLLPIYVIAFILYLIIPGQWIYLILLYTALVILLIIKKQKQWKIDISKEIIRISNGVLFKTRITAELYKLQAVKLRQSPYQRRHQLASLSLGFAWGNVSIPYLTLKEANDIYNFMLFKMEESGREWM